MINCLIIDDEPLAQEVLENHIRRSPQLNLLGKCNNALEAFRALHQQKVDLLFLDIKMPGISGLDLIRSLKAPPAVIFTTAFADHAVAGFELDAIDYVLKPVTYERFQKSLGKMLKTYAPDAAEERNYTYFKVSGQLLKIQHADIRYAQSVKDYILLTTPHANRLTHMTMKYLEELLPAATFLRVHRSYIVNLNMVDKFDKNSVTIGDTVIPVGENYRQQLGLIK